MLVRALLIVDDADLERRLDRIFEPLEAAVATAPHKAILWDRVQAFPADLIVVGRSSLPDPIADTVETIQCLPERPEVIVISEEEHADERARLLIAGCKAVLNASLDDRTLRDAFRAFVNRQRMASIERLQHEIDRPVAKLSDFESLSVAMQSFLRIVKRVVEPDSSLLIQGETGVGKERLARAIHSASPRAAGPFIPVILSAYPETLIEGELFGYEKGAFTGALRARRGCFEMAHGGTIFLDEIGELPQHIQVKLLRVLQERVIKRLGSEEATRINVRVMAATNRDLHAEVLSERFRSDLYYRLSVVTLDVPPLRERRKDVSRLCEQYLAEFRVRFNTTVSAFCPEAMSALEAYSWPGNIRELMNVVERSVLLCDGDQITLEDLPRTIACSSRQGTDPPTPGSAMEMLVGSNWQAQPWKDVRDSVIRFCEQAYFAHQLGMTNGNVDDTARRADINPRSLYDVMKRHGLRKEAFKVGGE